MQLSCINKFLSRFIPIIRDISEWYLRKLFRTKWKLLFRLRTKHRRMEAKSSPATEIIADCRPKNPARRRVDRIVICRLSRLKSRADKLAKHVFLRSWRCVLIPEMLINRPIHGKYRGGVCNNESAEISDIVRAKIVRGAKILPIHSTSIGKKDARKNSIYLICRAMG